MSQAAIVIPVYKVQPNFSETQSLKQSAGVFSNEKIILVCPQSLDVTVYTDILPVCDIIRFSNEYFSSISGYNKLLLSEGFYRSFTKFEYILIVQTDVWVFSNQLSYWCQKGYDYIGAPWIEKPPFTKKINLLPMNKWMEGKVGNGGFSLRKVSSHLNVASKLAFISWLFNKNEDFFWSLVVPKLFDTFKIPDLKEAVYFAFELAPETAYEMTGHTLPFAVHAWEKHSPKFWKTFITLPPNQKR